MIKAVFFDLDGVLVDMCELHKNALNRALQEIEGFVISEADHYSIYNGLPTLQKLKKMVHNNIIQEDNVKKINQLKQLYTEHYINEYIKPDFNKTELLRKLKLEDKVIACVTNSTRSTAIMMLKHAKLWNDIDFLIANDDTTNPKPSPDPYILAWNKSKLEKKEIVVFEDNAYGIQSAESAGLNCVPVSDYSAVNYDFVRKYL
jgi:HAD superfamily hydrolase (TIGR01509 family)